MHQYTQTDTERVMLYCAALGRFITQCEYELNAAELHDLLLHTPLPHDPKELCLHKMLTALSNYLNYSRSTLDVSNTP